MAHAATPPFFAIGKRQLLCEVQLAVRDGRAAELAHGIGADVVDHAATPPFFATRLASSASILRSSA